MSCPRDTNGDGDCGQWLCPDCGYGRIPEPAAPEPTRLDQEMWWLR